MRKIIYNDIKESVYYTNYGDLTLYFSSELYRDKFKAKSTRYIIDERNKLHLKYNCVIQCDEMLALNLYQKIEKRGFRVINNKTNEELKKDYIIDCNLWNLSYIK